MLTVQSETSETVKFGYLDLYSGLTRPIMANHTILIYRCINNMCTRYQAKIMYQVRYKTRYQTIHTWYFNLSHKRLTLISIKRYNPTLDPTMIIIWPPSRLSQTLLVRDSHLNESMDHVSCLASWSMESILWKWADGWNIPHSIAVLAYMGSISRVTQVCGILIDHLMFVRRLYLMSVMSIDSHDDWCFTATFVHKVG